MNITFKSIELIESIKSIELIESIEIDNEPDAMLWDLHLPLAVAAGAYEGIVTSCGRGIRAVATAKELPAVGLSIDGQGYWESKGGNLTFARRVLTNKTVARMLVPRDSGMRAVFASVGSKTFCNV